jgi:hypothetical protein
LRRLFDWLKLNTHFFRRDELGRFIIFESVPALDIPAGVEGISLAVFALKTQLSAGDRLSAAGHYSAAVVDNFSCLFQDSVIISLS